MSEKTNDEANTTNNAEKTEAAPRTVPAAEVEYLEKYLKVCEKFLTRRIDEEGASKELRALNKRYKTQVNPKTIKNSVLGDHLGGYEGWVPSQVCY